jgi:hypothetical protein
MKSVVLSIAILVAVCLGPSGREGEEVKLVIRVPNDATLKKIAASDEKQTLEILGQLGSGRSDLASMLIKELDAATDNDKKCSFVYLMGLYRLEATVRELAKFIDLESKPRLNDAEFLWDRHPAVEALIKIGRPSIPAMLDNIKVAKGENVTKLSVDVIQYVETPVIAKMILQDAIAKEKDAEKVKILQDSLKYLKAE